LAFWKKFDDSDLQEMKPEYINLAANRQTQLTSLEDWKRRFIKGNLHLNVPPEYHQQYIATILKNQDIVSLEKFDLRSIK
jgi:hypothetical protein